MSGFANSDGSNNVFLGYSAGASNSSGNSNVFLGNYTGAHNVDGTNNVFLGAGAGYSNNDGSNKSKLLLNNKNDNTIMITKFIHDLSIQYNIDKKTIINKYFNYIIRHKPQWITNDFLNIIENIMHCTEQNIEHILNYFSHQLKNYYVLSKNDDVIKKLKYKLPNGFKE